MSKMFEALKKTEGDLADVALPLVDQDVVPETYGAVAADGADPAFALETASNDWTTDSSYEPALEPAGEIRTVSLRLRAGIPAFPFETEYSRSAEQYRIARTRIIHHPRQPRVIVLSSPGSGDGKTITSINLAGAMALKSNVSVLLVDADLRRSSVAKLLGIPQTPGLSDVISGACRMEDAIVQIEQFPNLYVIPGGNLIANPTELLDSGRWSEACDKFREDFKFTIIDAPPIAAVADYDLIQVRSDGVILVVRPDHTSRQQCLKALEIIPETKLIGTLMNCVPDWFLWKTNDYYSNEE